MNRLPLTAILIRLAGIASLIFTIYKAFIPLPPEIISGAFDLGFPYFFFHEINHRICDGFWGSWISFWAGIILSILVIRFSFFFAKLLWLGIPTAKDSTK